MQISAINKSTASATVAQNIFAQLATLTIEDANNETVNILMEILLTTHAPSREGCG